MARRRRNRDRGLTCAEVVELLTDYLDGALPAAVQARVEAHLARCGGCEIYLAQFIRTTSVLRGIELPGLPDDACAALVAAFHDWTG